jgi:2-oxoglutarate dehydrogenase E1 component
MVRLPRFGKDVVVDVVGYRRNGHNEQDDPTLTLPLSYRIIAGHPAVQALYAAKLQVWPRALELGLGA